MVSKEIEIIMENIQKDISRHIGLLEEIGDCAIQASACCSLGGDKKRAQRLMQKSAWFFMQAQESKQEVKRIFN